MGVLYEVYRLLKICYVKFVLRIILCSSPFFSLFLLMFPRVTGMFW